MVKIAVMEWDSFSQMVKKEIEEGVRKGSFRKQDDVIYAETLQSALRLLTPERMKLLSAVRASRPQSLYALAKLLKKDFKTISTDADILSNAHLLSLETYKDGKRTKVRPRFSGSKISLEIPV